MKQLKNLLPLAVTNLRQDIEGEEQPFILTPEEVEEVLYNALQSAKDHLRWKMRQTELLSIGEIEIRLAGDEGRIENLVDRREVLRIANSNKHYWLWEQERREKEKVDQEAKEKELRDTWTARQMLSLMRWTSKNEFSKDLIEDHDATLPVIKALCYFLSEDKRFETELGFSLSKGLVLRGKCGIGKTYTAQCLRKNPLKPIFIHSLIEIAGVVKSDGEYPIRLPERGVLYLDDVGSEEATVNHFGTRINWLKDFLETFYLRNSQYHRLILSTNCGPSQLEEKYGFRVRSRMKEMFNILDIESEIDLRGMQ